MRIIIEKWSGKYKKSIDCNNPKGFSQKAHCAGRKARQAGRDTKSEPVDEEVMDVSSDSDQFYFPEGYDFKEIPPVEVYDEELDRCARIAKRKYKVWPSAYASGAAVKCRKGKIWKGLKEEEDVEEGKKKYKPRFDREEKEGLHGWFARNRGKGWVNCRTGGPCGRESADEGGKYPACRPTLAQCKSAGKGPLRKKRGPKAIRWTKTNEGTNNMDLHKIILEEMRAVKLELMSEGMRYHVETRTSLYDPIYRPGSSAFSKLLSEARELKKLGHVFSEAECELLESNCGSFGMYEGKRVPLDVPMIEEELSEAEYKGKEVQLGKPQRGGSKKFYVYVKDGDRVKKISFGDPNLSVKVGDPKRRASFVARHNCKEKNDRLTAGYWSCRIGRYPHLTGAKQRYTWW
jgi:hypothetical protein